ncbi:unnamed protein product [Ceutorhynchus assimilis]|uniref:Chitin-binding type-2 domain-containing protein n=1 Tax=Ceutorhynchus assimilis TaxID=467358 RepID=A0A9N9M8Q4_9CUCU|nr:unnamed protein product [Ceutorhynchus assimilis]
MKYMRLILLITIFGFSVGDELGFKESLSNTDMTNRRRSTQVSKMQAQLIQATQKQHDQKKGKLVSTDKSISSRSVTQLPEQLASMQVISPSTSGTARQSSEGEIPAFKPIPPAAERASLTKSSPGSVGIGFSSLNSMRPSLSKFSIGSSKVPVDPSVAKVMAVVAVPKRKTSSMASGFSDRLISVGNNDADQSVVSQHSSNSLQTLLSTNNVTEEALEIALLHTQQMIKKLKTTTSTTTTTRKPVTSRYGTSLGKVMNAPKEYYPVGYDKNFDDNFAARVELPETSFYCEHQKHFPGLYADEDLGCMVFHVCALTDEGLIMKSFLCPESTLYDQAILKCNWWFYVDCKNSRKLYDSNIPISKSYQLMKALTFFSAYKKESGSTTKAPTLKISED